MRRRILTILFFSFSLTTYSQQWASELWHDGKVVLASGDTLTGLVKYDMQQDLIQFDNKRGNVEALTARKVLFIEIFDTTISQYRQFFSLPYSATTGYRTPVFFELLADGKLTLLVRENLEYRTYSSPYYYGSYSRLVMIYKFYFLKENGDITEFKGKKSDLLDLMGKYANEIDEYMKDNKLKLEVRNDFMKIVTHYNSFFKA